MMIPCDYCAKTFMSSSAKENHTASVHGAVGSSQTIQQAIFEVLSGISNLYNNEIHTCSYCLQQFSTSQQLQQHKNSKHRNIHVCEHCYQEFAGYTDLQQHKQAKHAHCYKTKSSNDKFTCTHCPRKFSTSSQLQQHQYTLHKDVNYFLCRPCSQEFRTRSALEQHNLAKHQKKNDKGGSKVGGTVSQNLKQTTSSHYSCVDCHQVFAAKQHLQQHNLAKHPKKIDEGSFKVVGTVLQNLRQTKSSHYSCVDCNQVFAAKQHLEQHNEAKHPKKKQLNINRSSNDTFTCTQCPQKFSTLLQLQQHQNTSHKDVNHFYCCPCSQMFKTRLDIKRHYLAKHPELLNKLNSEDSGTVSIDIKQEKSCYHFCDDCHQVFTTEQSLEQHKVAKHPQLNISKVTSVISLSESTVCCYFCPQKFTSLKQLETHNESVHKNKDYYPCSYCSQPLFTHVGRVEHMQLVHNYSETVQNISSQGTLSCTQCFEKFTEKTDLDKHLRNIHENIHADEHFLKVHINACRYCHEKFFEDADMKQHLLKIHDIPCEDPTEVELSSGTASSSEDHLQVYHQIESRKDRESRKIGYITCENSKQGGKLHKCESDQDSVSGNHIQDEEKRNENWEEMFRHNDENHKEVLPRCMPTEEQFHCIPCDIKFPTLESRAKHYQEVHIMVCSYCNQNFFKDVHLKQHLQQVHNISYDDKDSQNIDCSLLENGADVSKDCKTVFPASLEQYQNAESRNNDSISENNIQEENQNIDSISCKYDETVLKKSDLCCAPEDHIQEDEEIEKRNIPHEELKQKKSPTTDDESTYFEDTHVKQHLEKIHNFHCKDAEENELTCIQQISGDLELKQDLKEVNRNIDFSTETDSKQLSCSQTSSGSQDHPETNRDQESQNIDCNLLENDAKHFESISGNLLEQHTDIKSQNIISEDSEQNLKVHGFESERGSDSENYLQQRNQNIGEYDEQKSVNKSDEDSVSEDHSQGYEETKNKNIHVISHEDVEKKKKEKNSENFGCGYCDKSFKSLKGLDQHIIDSHTIVKCKYCDEEFTNLKNMIRHTDQNHKEAFPECIFINPRNHFMCILCDITFPTKELRGKHYQEQHIIACKYCHKTFFKDDDFKQHLQEKHKNVDFFPCPVCKQLLHSQSDWETHFESIHGDTDLQIVDYEVLEKHEECFLGEESREFTGKKLLEDKESADVESCAEIFPSSALCPVCNLQFSNHVQRDHHIMELHIFKCDCCPKVFTDSEFLKKHEESKHKNIVSDQSGNSEGSHICPHCSACFITKQVLEDHKKIVHSSERLEDIRGEQLHEQLEHTRRILKQLSVPKK